VGTPRKSCILFSLVIVVLASACGAPVGPTPPADRGTDSATFAITGTVRQSGEGSPLEGVSVEAWRVPPTSPPFMTTAAAAETTTNGQGAYRLDGLTGTISLRVHKAGYEPAPEDFFVAGDAPANVTLQLALVVPLGATTVANLNPDDPRHTIAADVHGFLSCEAPCRIIRVVNAVPGRLRLRIRFLDEPEDLGVLVEGTSLGCCRPELAGTFVIAPAKPLRVYVRPMSGSVDRPRPFELTTEAQP